MRKPTCCCCSSSFAWRLVAAGSGLERASLHVGTLHPQLFGFAWNWSRADGLCDEVKVAPAALQADAYKRNPLFRVIEHGERFRGDTRDAATRARYPLLAELATSGITEYLAEVLTTGSAYHNAVTLATKDPAGFSPEQRTAIETALKLLGLHVERHIVLRIAHNVLNTYLGSAAGDAVLAGSIKRGSGRPIRSIIWSSDLRGFTELSERLAGNEVTVLLDAYFECLVTAIADHGGEILKFIGDGLLAVFSFSDETAARQAAASALAAAQDALVALDRLNAAPPPHLAAIDGWRPLKTGIALHSGEVFFGNIGSPDRLDFTVIGKAVNEASRVESLTGARAIAAYYRSRRHFARSSARRSRPAPLARSRRADFSLQPQHASFLNQNCRLDPAALDFTTSGVAHDFSRSSCASHDGTGKLTTASWPNTWATAF